MSKQIYAKEFRQPVDVEKYNCYDYYVKIKKPMDISAIIVMLYLSLTHYGRISLTKMNMRN